MQTIIVTGSAGLIGSEASKFFHISLLFFKTHARNKMFRFQLPLKAVSHISLNET